MNNIDEILDNLQKQQPVFDEEAMLESIMESLPERQPSIGQTAVENKPALLPRLVRNISSVAAVALLVICCWQAFDRNSADARTVVQAQAYQIDYSYYSDCKTPQEALQRYETRKNNTSITNFKQKIYEKL